MKLIQILDQDCSNNVHLRVQLLAKHHPKVLAQLQQIRRDTGNRLVQCLYDKVYPRARRTCKACKGPSIFSPNYVGYAQFCSRQCSGPTSARNAQKSVQKKHGVKNVSQLQFIKDKKAATCFVNHGVKWPQQSKKVRRKTDKTVQEKYGVANIMQLKKTKRAAQNTNLERYGFKQAMHNPEVLRRTLEAHGKSMGGTKQIKIGRRTFDYQGYEHHVLKDLVKRGWCKPRGIETRGLLMIDYRAPGGKHHKTLPDIRIQRNGKEYLIEVKSEWTLGLCNEETRLLFYIQRAKAKAANEQGLKYVVALAQSDGTVQYFRHFEKVRRSSLTH